MAVFMDKIKWRTNFDKETMMMMNIIGQMEKQTNKQKKR